jgi:hypothetical protein
MIASVTRSAPGWFVTGLLVAVGGLTLLDAGEPSVVRTLDIDRKP